MKAAPRWLGDPTRARRVALAVFLLSLGVYHLNGRSVASLDSSPARLLPFALLTTGTLHLDRFEAVLPTERSHAYWYTRARSGHLVSIYPVVVPLVVTPLFAPAVWFTEWSGVPPPRWFGLAQSMEKLSASLIAALSVAVVFLLVRRWARPATAALVTIAYAFGTETWVIGSQALWQHGLSELLLAALLLRLAQGTGFVWAGVLSGLLVANRLPNVTFAAAAAIFVLVYQREHLAAFIAPFAALVALLLGYNLTEFGHPLGGYGHVLSIDLFHPFSADLFEGIAGLLVSPARGLLLFSPFLLFLAAAPGAPMDPLLRNLLRCFMPAAGAQLLIHAAYVDWMGGCCYGPRYLTDMTPVLMLALIPAVDRLRQPALRAVFVLLLAFAIAVQGIGAFCYPKGGSDPPVDVWNPHNLQYVREWRGGLAKPLFRRRPPAGPLPGK